jgi:hypothetical protein
MLLLYDDEQIDIDIDMKVASHVMLCYAIANSILCPLQFNSTNNTTFFLTWHYHTPFDVATFYYYFLFLH